MMNLRLRLLNLIWVPAVARYEIIPRAYAVRDRPSLPIAPSPRPPSQLPQRPPRGTPKSVPPSLGGDALMEFIEGEIVRIVLVGENLWRVGGAGAGDGVESGPERRLLVDRPEVLEEARLGEGQHNPTNRENRTSGPRATN